MSAGQAHPKSRRSHTVRREKLLAETASASQNEWRNWGASEAFEAARRKFPDEVSRFVLSPVAMWKCWGQVKAQLEAADPNPDDTDLDSRIARQVYAVLKDPLDDGYY